jgi:hypothetical protein
MSTPITNTVSFTPLVITVETIQRLSQEANYANLLALYMAYVEITTWQKDNSIKATRSFMAQRLHWQPNKVSRLKGRLIELGLIEDIKRHRDDGKISGHFILVKFIVAPDSHANHIVSGGLQYQVGNGSTNANDLQISANDPKTSASRPAGLVKQASSTGQLKNMRDAFTQVSEALGLSGRAQPTEGRLRRLKTRAKNMSWPAVLQAAQNLGRDDFMTGSNEASKRYATIDYLLRNDEIIDRWANKTHEVGYQPTNGYPKDVIPLTAEQRRKYAGIE